MHATELTFGIDGIVAWSYSLRSRPVPYDTGKAQLISSILSPNDY